MPKKKYAHDVPTKIPQSWIDDDDGTKVNWTSRLGCIPVRLATVVLGDTCS
jgi:hypothetical protein